MAWETKDGYYRGSVRIINSYSFSRGSNDFGQQRKTQKRPDDDIRLKVLTALFEKDGLRPNIENIAKITGLTRKTVYESIDYLNSSGVISGYEPIIDSSKMGCSVLTILLMQADMSHPETFQEFLKTLANDNHVCLVCDFAGMGSFNFMVHGIYKSVEEYYHNMKSSYYERIPGYFDLIKKSNVFHFPTTSSKNYKKTSISKQAISLLNEIRPYTGSGSPSGIMNWRP